jgi:hypothetical protein
LFSIDDRVLQTNFGLWPLFASNFVPSPRVWPKKHYIYPLGFYFALMEMEIENTEIERLQAATGGKLEGEPWWRVDYTPWEPQEEGMMSTAASFPSVVKPRLSNQ